MRKPRSKKATQKDKKLLKENVADQTDILNSNIETKSNASKNKENPNEQCDTAEQTKELPEKQSSESAPDISGDINSDADLPVHIENKKTILQRLFGRKAKNPQRCRRASKRAMLKEILNKLEIQDGTKIRDAENQTELIRKLDALNENLDAFETHYSSVADAVDEIRKTVKSIDSIKSKLDSIANLQNKKSGKPKKSKNGIEAEDTLAALYGVFMKMKECENYDQIYMKLDNLQALFEEYENVKGVKLEWLY